jgi:hypothetical protein
MATNFSINDFRAKLGDGGARPNQFSVQIFFPDNVPGGGQSPGTSTYLVNIAELPGISIGTVPVYYRGREIKLAGDKSFAPFTCTILNDSAFTLRTALENWMNLIESNVTKAGFTNPGNYFGSITVTQLDRIGRSLRSYSMTGAYPNDLGAVGLDFSANDQLSSFQVAFQYQYFEVFNGTAQTTQNLTSIAVQSVPA